MRQATECQMLRVGLAEMQITPVLLVKLCEANTALGVYVRLRELASLRLQGQGITLKAEEWKSKRVDECEHQPSSVNEILQMARRPRGVCKIYLSRGRR